MVDDAPCINGGGGGGAVAVIALMASLSLVATNTEGTGARVSHKSIQKEAGKRWIVAW